MRLKTHFTQHLPLAIMAMLVAWHFHGYLTTEALGGLLQHAGLTGVAVAMAVASLFFWNAEKDLSRYLESIIAPARAMLLGLSCAIMGALHFITVQAEPVFLKMAYMVMLLALYEAGSLANRFHRALSRDPGPATREAVKMTIGGQMGMLALVLVLSVVLLYLSLMVVVGFTQTWAVAMLSALLLVALAFLTMVRRI